MKWLKVLWCEIFHWGDEKHVVSFYSNRTHRYKCDKCNHEYDD
jgi:transposase-like protein